MYNKIGTKYIILYKFNTTKIKMLITMILLPLLGCILLLFIPIPLFQELQEGKEETSTVEVFSSKEMNIEGLNPILQIFKSITKSILNKGDYDLLVRQITLIVTVITFIISAFI
jgi:hypothetical protein